MERFEIIGTIVLVNLNILGKLPIKVRVMKGWQLLQRTIHTP